MEPISWLLGALLVFSGGGNVKQKLALNEAGDAISAYVAKEGKNAQELTVMGNTLAIANKDLSKAIKDLEISNATAKDTGGIKITESETVSSAYIYYGKSLIDQLNEYIDLSLSSTGTLKKTENTAASDLLDLNIDLADVDEKVEALTARYKKQFSSMESVVTSLKSTGDYLTNMMDSWNSDK